MCLRFDPVKNTLKQTCSGTCKNKCGFKLDEDSGKPRPSSARAKVVRIEKGEQSKVQFQASPFLERNS